METRTSPSPALERLRRDLAALGYADRPSAVERLATALGEDLLAVLLADLESCEPAPVHRAA